MRSTAARIGRNIGGVAVAVGKGNRCHNMKQIVVFGNLDQLPLVVDFAK